MNHEQQKQIEAYFPSDYRFHLKFADLEGPSQLVVSLPDYILLQHATSIDRFNKPKDWETVGYIIEPWPLDAEDAIHFNANPADDVEKHALVFQDALSKAGLEDRFIIEITGQKSDQK